MRSKFGKRGDDGYLVEKPSGLMENTWGKVLLLEQVTILDLAVKLQPAPMPHNRTGP